MFLKKIINAILLHITSISLSALLPPSVEAHDIDRKENYILFLEGSLGGPFKIEEDLTSFSNHNCIIRECVTNEKWVMRIPNDISNFLSDRRQERDVLTWAQQEGLSLLEVKACDFDNGYLLTRFLSGKSRSASDFTDSTTLLNALTLLHRLHSNATVPIFTHFEPLKRFRVCSDCSINGGCTLPAEVHKIASQLEELLSQIPSNRFQLAPCHNDPCPDNFFYQDGCLYLHDWEISSINDPIWDLTHFSVLGQVDPEIILSLYPTTDCMALEKMTFFRPFIFFNTVVWASLERLQRKSTIPEEIVEKLYREFLIKIEESLKSCSFQDSFQRLSSE